MATNINAKPSSARVRRKDPSLAAVWVLIRREWLKVFKEPSRAVGIMVQPLLFWWVIGSGFVPTFHLAQSSAINYQTYFFPGVLALVLLFSAIFSMITLIDDKSSGFMQAVMVSPSKKSSVVFGKMLGACSIACVQVFLFLPLMPLAEISLAQVQWPLFAAFVVLGATSFSSIGFLMAWMSPSSSTFHALMSVFLIPMWILSGAMFPLENTWMAFFSYINPASWLVEGFRFTLLSAQLNISSADVFFMTWFSAAKLMAFSVVVTAAGVFACYRNR